MFYPFVGRNGRGTRDSLVHVSVKPTGIGRNQDGTAHTVCGRTFTNVTGTWSADQWAPMWGTGYRLGRTHVTSVCLHCVAKAHPVCETCGDTPEWCEHLRTRTQVVTPEDIRKASPVRASR
jgi:hypothetical protein